METIVIFVFFVALVPILLTTGRVFSPMPPFRRWMIGVNLLVVLYELFFLMSVYGIFPHMQVHFGMGVIEPLFLVFVLPVAALTQIILLSVMSYKITNSKYLLIPLLMNAPLLAMLHIEAAQGGVDNDFYVTGGGLVGLYYDYEKVKQERSRRRQYEDACAPRDDEQMFYFILSQARELFGDSTLMAKPVDCPSDSLEKQVSVSLLNLPGDRTLYIYQCRDSMAREKLMGYFEGRESVKYRGVPLVQVSYGNLVMEHYSGDSLIVDFMKSVVIDTRQGMVQVMRWQEWLAQRGVEMKIADARFELHARSLRGLVGGSYQALPLQIYDTKVELICCADAASAQQLLGAFTQMCSVIDPPVGADSYRGCRYGRFLVMTLCNENYERIQPLIEEFWK